MAPIIMILNNVAAPVGRTTPELFTSVLKEALRFLSCGLLNTRPMRRLKLSAQAVILIFYYYYLVCSELIFSGISLIHLEKLR